MIIILFNLELNLDTKKLIKCNPEAFTSILIELLWNNEKMRKKLFLLFVFVCKIYRLIQCDGKNVMTLCTNYKPHRPREPRSLVLFWYNETLNIFVFTLFIKVKSWKRNSVSVSRINNDVEIMCTRHVTGIIHHFDFK